MCVLDSADSEYGSELQDSIQDRVYLDQCGDYQLLKKVCSIELVKHMGLSHLLRDLSKSVRVLQATLFLVLHAISAE
jgi:hypothetical protein